MNAVEIEAAVSDLAAEPFQADEFPFQFLAAFDKKETQLKRLRKGDSNKSDVTVGDRRAVLLQSNIHMAVCPLGETRATLERLKASPQTIKAKAKFVLATDGELLESEFLETGEAIASEYSKFAEHIGFFLPLAGISTVREIKDNPIDVRATGRLNKLYEKLMEQNPGWGTEAGRHRMNHFMARLIFCFFAEDTNIFPGAYKLFSSTVQQFTESDGSNTHQVLETLFRMMNTAPELRDAAQLPGYAMRFPYVNGGLFSDAPEAPVFTRIARSYLLQAGDLDWKHINPDIFGSMIQAVADDAERGALGMHYTSVPNILKVLNPLFLDELREKLAAAEGNRRALKALRTRLSRIRVFDPACGSGNFLVIAYKELRCLESKIDALLDERPSRSVLSLRNFRGIEIRDFAVEIARLALVIAEYQANVLYLGEQQARLVFLPLSSENWITCGNALRLDWLTVCPPEGGAVTRRSNDLFQEELEQTGIDFENEGGETYICGNPPYVGTAWQSREQKEDLSAVFSGVLKTAGSLDYVTAWFYKGSKYSQVAGAIVAFVATNSVCQGQQAQMLWPLLRAEGVEIRFAYTSLKWSNLASHNAGVTVVIVGVGMNSSSDKRLFISDNAGELTERVVASIGPYLIPGDTLYVQKSSKPVNNLSEMLRGNSAYDDGFLLLTMNEARVALKHCSVPSDFVRPFVGSHELINGAQRRCIWVSPETAKKARENPWLADRFEAVRMFRAKSERETTFRLASVPYQFGEIRDLNHESALVIPRVSSESRPYLPVALLGKEAVVGDRNFALYDAPLWNMALIASRLHWVWIGTVCVRMRTDFSYSNTLGWNTFPVPTLTEDDKAELTRCAEDILLAREAHFPATIADLYDPESMPDNLRAAHDRNDETLERIYIGRRFKNDTERLETLFAMYAKMTEKQGTAQTKQAARKPRTKRVASAEVRA